jgi:sarcosine oxidase
MIGPRHGTLVAGALRSAEAHGLQHELLDAAQVSLRFPAFRPAPDMVGVWEPRAGVLFPEACIAAHLEGAARAGASLRMNTPALSWRATASGVEVETAAGAIVADQLVLTAGAWLPRFLGDLRVPLAVERVVQAWFEPAAHPEHLAPERCPITIWEYDTDRYFYAFPLLDGTVKAALHHQGRVVDPDHVPREVGADGIDRILGPMRKHMPDAAGRNRDAKVCMYTNTPDEHFILDRHPGHEQVIIASACSGHGFKFASAIGEVIAEMVRGNRTHSPIELFDIARFTG